MPDEIPNTDLPPDVEQLLDQADVIAILQQHSRSLDAHRRELLLMWIAVLGLAGLLALLAVRELRRDA